MLTNVRHFTKIYVGLLANLRQITVWVHVLVEVCMIPTYTCIHTYTHIYTKGHTVHGPGPRARAHEQYFLLYVYVYIYVYMYM